MFRIGLVINPYAGIGGDAAFKGSDGEAIRAQGIAGDLPLKANSRTQDFLTALLPHQYDLHFFTASGLMGEQSLQAAGFDHVTVAYHFSHANTTAQDTKNAITHIIRHHVDILIFVGGDGTARDVCDVIGLHTVQPVAAVGLPSGVKMYSGVYGIHPSAVADIVLGLQQNKVTEIAPCEVRDIDEQAFREGRVISQFYGELNVPQAIEYVQQVKQGGGIPDELALLDIACEVREKIEQKIEETHHNLLTIFAPGSTTAYIQESLGLPNTLLGVDVCDGITPLKQDVNGEELHDIVTQHLARHPHAEVVVVLTAIGGQGHLIGRGNQQLRPETLQKILRKNIWPVATEQKLINLQGRPLIIDSGSSTLNQQWTGMIPVITGYNRSVLYRLEGK